ncbi:MAG TPA: hypothetical protein VNN21_05735 [Dehalococcoidia bacterium]|nr:hypothetical protein [Dehalococcoidia bacterium]
MDVPQLVIPAFLFNGIVCGLTVIAAWHATAIILAVYRKVTAQE